MRATPESPRLKDECHTKMLSSVLLTSKDKGQENSEVDMDTNEDETHKVEIHTSNRNITQDSKDKIVEDQSYYEKQAIMDNFKREWKKEQGLASMFDKRKFYSSGGDNRIKSANVNFRKVKRN